MPIDPSIYSTIRPVAPIQTPSPLDLIGTVERVQSLREQTELRRLAGEKARQAAADDAQVRSVFAAHGDDVDAALADLYRVNPRAAGPIKEQVEKTRKEHFAALTNEMDYKGKQLTHGLNLLPGMNEPTGYRAGRPMIAAMSPELDQFLPPEYDPETTPALLNQLNTIALSAKERLDLQQQGFKQLLGDKPIDGLSKLYRTAQNQEQWDNVGRGAVAVGTKSALLDQFGKTWSPEAVAHAASLGISSEKAAELEGQAEGRAQTAANQAALREQGAHSPIYKEWQDYQSTGGTLPFDAYQTMDVNRRRAVTHINTGQGQPGDLKEVIAGMKDGTLPPALPGRGSTAYTGLMAEAHRQGFDLATAATDWTAAQKHFATLNGAQQTRLRQAVDTAAHSLDVIDTLAGQWKGGSFPILNRANLALAKNGAYGTQVAATARALDAQIADVTAELANAYMGGNSPTDHALELAAKNLSSDWSEATLKQMTALARTNLKIRQNAIKNVGAIGASEDNPYVPGPATSTVRPKRYNPATGKVE